MKRNSGFIGKKEVTTTEGAKGIHDLHDVHVKRVATAWPEWQGLFLLLLL